MSANVQHLLESFDTLSEADKREAAIEIFRRLSATGEGDLTDSGLIEAADDLFRAMDAEEAGHAQS